MQENLDADIELRHWDKMRKGDKASFEFLYNRYFKLLYNYSKKIGIDTVQVEDAIHDLFVDLWRYRENLSSTTSVRFYLYRSLRRRVKRNVSAHTYLFDNKLILEDTFGAISPSSEQNIIDAEADQQRINRLKKLLNDLSPRQYEALVLRFYDDFCFEEIGSILNVNEQSARNRLTTLPSLKQ